MPRIDVEAVDEDTDSTDENTDDSSDDSTEDNDNGDSEEKPQSEQQSDSSDDADSDDDFNEYTTLKHKLAGLEKTKKVLEDSDLSLRTKYEKDIHTNNLCVADYGSKRSKSRK